MKRSTVWQMLVLAMLVLAIRPAVLQAQGQANQQPRRDDAVVRTSMRWQLPDDRRGVRTAPILLLSREDVASDLGLNADQKVRTWEMINQLGPKAAQLKGRNDTDSQKLRREVDQMQLEWLRKELKPEQLARLTQIDLQWEVPSAIVSRPQVTEAMHLTPHQKTKITELVQQSRTGRGQKSPDEVTAELTRSVFSQLDETQQQAWRALIGPELGQPQRTASAR
ncbi:MAG: hypothetical protein ACKO0V_21430 [bacterium]